MDPCHDLSDAAGKRLRRRGSTPLPTGHARGGLAWAGVLSLLHAAGFSEYPSVPRKGCNVKGKSLTSTYSSLICPLCEGGELRPSGQHSARCASCAGLVSPAVLEALREITALPDALP